MDIAEILKDCPKGTKLYSPLLGECDLIYVDCTSNVLYPIITKVGDFECSFTKDGLVYRECTTGECLLFPSKENRDWSTFEIPKKEYDFKPFDKVLVRNSDSDVWNINLFSFIVDDNEYKYVCSSDSWQQCIPYEGNEHLLNTTNNPE